METPPGTLVDRTIAVTRALRKVANTLMDRAHEARSFGQLSLDEYFMLTERYQQIQDEANRACHEAVESLPDMEVHLGPIESATKDLEAASLLLAKVTDVLAVSALLLQALAGLVVAIVKPEPAAFAAVAATLAATVQGIHSQLSH